MHERRSARARGRPPIRSRRPRPSTTSRRPRASRTRRSADSSRASRASGPRHARRSCARSTSSSYRPNLTARSLKSGRSHRIGALTHEISTGRPQPDRRGRDRRRPRSRLRARHGLARRAQSALDRGVARAHHPARPRRRPRTRLDRRDDPGVRDDRLPRPGLHRRRGGRRGQQPPVGADERGLARAHRAPGRPRPPTPRAHRRPLHVVGGPQSRRGVTRRRSRHQGLESAGVLHGRLVGEIRLRRRSPGSPTSRMRRRSSPRTTRWRSAPCSP